MFENSVCFSGHRPEKLPNCGDENSVAISRLKSLLYKDIYDSINDGYTDFITGLARGIDTWAAEIVIHFKSKHDNLRLICVKPYDGYGENWRGYDKWQFSHIIEKSDELVTICDAYQKNCMKLRNEYMVNHSSKLIAIVENYRSGTGQTIRYAQKQGLDVKIIDIKENVQLLY